MNPHAAPEVTLDVELSNPGEVLAVLGLFELQDQLSPGTTGYFSQSSFHMISEGQLSNLLDAVRTAELSIERDSRTINAKGVGKAWPFNDKAWPVRLKGSSLDLVIDPWIQPNYQALNSVFKTWGGPTDVYKHLLKRTQALLPEVPPGAERSLFSVPGREPLRPSGIDLRSAISKEDLGYAYDMVGLLPITYPWVELLGFVGLQFYRPTQRRDRQCAYDLWTTPVPPLVARAVFGQALPQVSSSKWRFGVGMRSKGAKTFDRADMDLLYKREEEQW